MTYIKCILIYVFKMDTYSFIVLIAIIFANKKASLIGYWHAFC